MNKSILKYLFIPLFLIGISHIVSCSGEEESIQATEITVNDLPMDAQSFIKKYFNEHNVTKVSKDIEGDITIYEVEFEEGFQIVFNNSGEWQQVVAPYGKTIPTGFIPEQVMQTLTNRFQGYGINQINTTGEGYKVELSDNQGGASIDVFFDMSGEITNIDQLD